MTRDDILAEFEASGALLTGHFILASGLHSGTYLQCARVMMDAQRGEKLCAALAEKLRTEQSLAADIIISPAMGGVVVGYEMGRQLGLPAIFFERIEGKFVLRRGFEIEEGMRCLLVEDVVTTGISSRECMDAARQLGGVIAGACSLVDRSGGRTDLGVPLTSLLQLDIPNYAEHELPEALRAIEPVKPGSRILVQK